MHLVFVTSLVPDGVPSTGYEIANDAIIGALRRQGIRVTVVGYVRPGRIPADSGNTIVLGTLDPTTDKASLGQKIRWLVDAFSAGLTVSSAKLRAISDSDFKQALETAGPYDGYVLNAVQMTAAFEAVLTDKPALFVAHNVEHVSARQNAKAANHPIKRFLFAREARLLEAIETRLCRRARFVFTLADADRHALGIATPEKSATLPLVTRTDAVALPKTRTISYDAALIGTWTWQPNRIGLEWFLGKVVPLLDPDFKIAVGGSTPNDVKRRHPNIQFAGRVDNADEFVCAAGVVPLVSRAGTGVQLKTIETFELGLPAVATTSAVRGIATIPKNCVVTDEPQAFADAMMGLAANPNAHVNGSAFFNAQFDGLNENIATGLHAFGRERETAPA